MAKLFMMLLVVATVTTTTALLATVATVGQAPTLFYAFFGIVGYGGALALALSVRHVG